MYIRNYVYINMYNDVCYKSNKPHVKPMWNSSENSILGNNITENLLTMTKCHLFWWQIERLESGLYCNKWKNKFLEWCCPAELCVVMEMFLCAVH